MYNLDLYIINSIHDFCARMGNLFGLGAIHGAYITLIFLGVFVYALLGGKCRW